jgi:hypothetical protein
MRAFYFIIGFLLVVTNLYAQPILTSACNPSVGDNWSYKEADTNSVLPGSGGANVTWNFTNLNLDPDIQTMNWVSPAGTQYFSYYPTATMATTQTSESFITYWQKNSSMLGWLGQADSSSSGLKLMRTYDGVGIPYFRMPLSYGGTTYVDSCRYYYTEGSNWHHYFEIITQDADGYGTLNLPNGVTYSNALRIRFYGIGIDTTNIGLGYVSEYRYAWFVSGFKFPVFQIMTYLEYITGVGPSGWKTVRYTTTNVPIGIRNISEAIPSEYSLMQNYPNPFNPTTNIKYQITNKGFVTLKVFDIMGREISNLVNEKQNAGTYEVTFDASSLSSGVYFYRLETGNFTDTKKLMVIK